MRAASLLTTLHKARHQCFIRLLPLARRGVLVSKRSGAQHRRTATKPGFRKPSNPLTLGLARPGFRPPAPPPHPRRCPAPRCKGTIPGSRSPLARHGLFLGLLHGRHPRAVPARVRACGRLRRLTLRRRDPRGGRRLSQARLDLRCALMVITYKLCVISVVNCHPARFSAPLLRSPEQASILVDEGVLRP